MAKNNLTKTEQEAVEICAKVQKLCKILGINLTTDIRQNCEDLVALYKLRRVMNYLSEILPRHEVIDRNTGKFIGYLYDNEYIEGVMLSTNIGVEAQIQHTENHLRKISIKKYLL